MGIGGAPDAADFGDDGADTLGHIDASVSPFHIPNLEKMGLGNLKPMRQVAPVGTPTAYYCGLREASRSKDNTLPSSFCRCGGQQLPEPLFKGPAVFSTVYPFICAKLLIQNHVQSSPFLIIFSIKVKIENRVFLPGIWILLL